MVRAILDGKKTMTRRVVRVPAGWTATTMFDHTSVLLSQPRPARRSGEPAFTAHKDLRCPYGVAGDRLWVRETHALLSMDKSVCAYRATCPHDEFDYVDGTGLLSRIKVTKWRPAIHMPRCMSRVMLEVAGVRVEPVQDISEHDVVAEGVELPPCSYVGRCNSNRCPRHGARHWRRAWAALWDGINGKRPGCAWADDPWVWAVSFRRVEP
jgi:hypothetical protein